MIDALLVAGATSAVIIGITWVLWLLFKQRHRGFHFPPQTDRSQFRFLSYRKIRLLTLLHCLFMVFVCTVTILFSW